MPTQEWPQNIEKTSIPQKPDKIPVHELGDELERINVDTVTREALSVVRKDKETVKEFGDALLAALEVYEKKVIPQAARDKEERVNMAHFLASDEAYRQDLYQKVKGMLSLGKEIVANKIAHALRDEVNKRLQMKRKLN